MTEETFLESNIFISFQDELVKLAILLDDFRKRKDNEGMISISYVIDKLNRALNEIPIILHPSLHYNLNQLRASFGIEAKISI
jgi:hypothetical protein